MKTLFTRILTGSYFRLSFAQEAYTPKSDLTGDWDVVVDPDLPNVLLIGDSISIGYTLGVRALLKGKANVLRPMSSNGKEAFNCGPTTTGLQCIDDWLGDFRWDVIHFNWGLHDLCYRHPDSKVYGNRDKIKGTLSTTLPDYEKNLERLLSRLEATKTKLIWANSTMVPEGEAGRKTGDELKYNAVAVQVMDACGIAINDLNALSARFEKECWSEPGDVHFSPAGYEKLAVQVAEVIGKTLPVELSERGSD